MEKMYIIYERAYGYSRVRSIEFNRNEAIEIAFDVNKGLQYETWVAEANIGESYYCNENAFDDTIIAFFK